MAYPPTTMPANPTSQQIFTLGNKRWVYDSSEWKPFSAFMTSAPVDVPVCNVSQLPAAATHLNTTFYVNDALTPSLGATVSGGGASACYVKSDGTNWKVS